MIGHLEYEWDQQDLNPAGHARTPRDAAVEDITERLSTLSPAANEAHCMNTHSLYLCRSFESAIFLLRSFVPTLRDS